MPSTAFVSAINKINAAFNSAMQVAVGVQSEIPQSQIAQFFAARIAKESAIRETISKSLTAWVETGRWPNMNQADALYVWDRLCYAKEFAEWLWESGFDSVSKTENQILVWLLVDCWENVGRAQWKLKNVT